MRKLIICLMIFSLFFMYLSGSICFAESEFTAKLKIQLEDIVIQNRDSKEQYDNEILGKTNILKNKYVVVHLYKQGQTKPIKSERWNAEHLIPSIPSHMPLTVTGNFIINLTFPEPTDTGTYNYYFRVGYESVYGSNNGQVYTNKASFKVKKMPLQTIIDYGLLKSQAVLTIPLPKESDFGLSSAEIPQPIDPVTGKPLSDFWGDPKPDDSILAKMFTRLVKDFMAALWNFFGVQDPVTLFFNVNPEDLFENWSEENIDFISRPDNNMYVDPSDDDTFLYTFNLKEYELMNLMFNEFNKFLQIPYAVAIAIIGLLLFLKGYNSEDRSTIKMFLGSILFFPLLIKFFPYLLEPLFWLNLTVVRAVGSTIENGLGIPLTDPFVTALIGSGTALNSIGVIIGTFFLFAAVGLLNFQYFIRRFMLAILIMMFPIVAFLQIYPSNRKVLSMWFSEFLANLFLQSAHAIVYLVFVGFIRHVQAPFIPVMAMLITLSTFSTFVRNLMGCQSNSNMAGSMMGISAIFGAGRIAGNILGGITGKNTEAEKAKTSLQTAQSTNVTTSPETLSSQPAELIQPAESDQATESGQTTEQTTQLSGTDTAMHPTGTAWGIAPRMRTDLKGTLRKLGAGTVVYGAMATGAIVGSAAAGPAGFGFGAMGGARSSEYVLRGGAYTKNVAGNIYDKESKIRKIQDDTGFTRDNAIIYAATGVNATPEEVIFDEEMTTQVANYSDVAGFPEYIKNRIEKNALAYAHEYLKEGYSFESVRKDAANLRKSLADQNLSVPEANNRILNEVIRPSIKSTPSSYPPNMDSTDI